MWNFQNNKHTCDKLKITKLYMSHKNTGIFGGKLYTDNQKKSLNSLISKPTNVYCSKCVMIDYVI